MGIFKENTKKTRARDESRFRPIRCICGSCRMDCFVAAGDDEEKHGEGAGFWIEVVCKKCNKTLYYNGA